MLQKGFVVEKSSPLLRRMQKTLRLELQPLLPNYTNHRLGRRGQVDQWLCNRTFVLAHWSKYISLERKWERREEKRRTNLVHLFNIVYISWIIIVRIRREQYIPDRHRRIHAHDICLAHILPVESLVDVLRQIDRLAAVRPGAVVLPHVGRDILRRIAGRGRIAADLSDVDGPDVLVGEEVRGVG